MRNPLVALVPRVFGRLRYPTLLVVTAVLFVVNLVLPDPLPFVDEILLGLLALLFARLRRRDDDQPTEAP